MMYITTLCLTCGCPPVSRVARRRKRRNQARRDIWRNGRGGEDGCLLDKGGGGEGKTQGSEKVVVASSPSFHLSLRPARRGCHLQFFKWASQNGTNHLRRHRQTDRPQPQRHMFPTGPATSKSSSNHCIEADTLWP